MITTKENQVLTTTAAKMWKREDGILQLQNILREEHTEQHARENIAAMTLLAGNALFPALIDIRNSVSISQKARQYYSGDETKKKFTAAALLVSSGVSMIIGNFFLGLNKPSFPVKVFLNEDKAVNWLKKMFLEMPNHKK